MNKHLIFNINDYVKVKLTPTGIGMYTVHYRGMEPTIDDDGYTNIQLWELMQIFGLHMGLGMSSPFGTTLIIDSEYLTPVKSKTHTP